MMKSKIRKVINKGDLSEIEIMEMMNYIMEGKATNMQISAFLVALRMKGETIKEITGCARIMRDKAENIQPNLEYCIDTCGTGGDRANTFNISTAVAFVASACGVFVAKHGNRLVSSKSGSADVLESLGININIKPNEVKKCIEEVGIGFMFAPTFHKSMKYVAPVRKELGVRTIFNILGVLTNPANTKGQIIGIFDEKLTDMVANVLNNLQLEKAMVVHGMDGLDEITTTDKTKVSELKDGKVLNYYISPEEYGIALSNKNIGVSTNFFDIAAIFKLGAIVPTAFLERANCTILPTVVAPGYNLRVSGPSPLSEGIIPCNIAPILPVASGPYLFCIPG